MLPALIQTRKLGILTLSIRAVLLLMVTIATQVSAQTTTVTVTAKTPPKVAYTKIRYVSPVSGQEMYKEYCAVCHGATANGNSPAATVLVPRPTDLTLLSNRNGGTFPAFRVRYRLMDLGYYDAGRATDMPCWGPALRSLEKTAPAMFGLRVHNLMAYLETMQAPLAKAGTGQGSTVNHR